MTNTLNHKVTSPNPGLMNNTNYSSKNLANDNQKFLNGINSNYYNLNSKGNNFNLHQRYKSSNSEMIIDNLNKINLKALNKNNLNIINNYISEEENAKIFFNNLSEKNLQKFSPTVSKELQLNLKTKYNLSNNMQNQFSGNFTTNNFNLVNGNKAANCKIKYLFYVKIFIIFSLLFKY
jgi:Cu/Ag efflux pump CusA